MLAAEVVCVDGDDPLHRHVGRLGVGRVPPCGYRHLNHAVIRADGQRAALHVLRQAGAVAGQGDELEVSHLSLARSDAQPGRVAGDLVMQRARARIGDFQLYPGHARVAEVIHRDDHGGTVLLAVDVFIVGPGGGQARHLPGVHIGAQGELAPVFVPGGEADVGLLLHARPLAVPEGGVFGAQGCIQSHAFIHSLCEAVRHRTGLRCIMGVDARVQVHLQQIDAGLHRQMHHAVIGVPFRLGELLVHGGALPPELVAQGVHPLCLQLVAGMIDVGIERFGAALAVQVIQADEDFLRVPPGLRIQPGEGGSHEMRHPFAPVQRIMAAPGIKIVGQVEELGQADLVALQVAGVEDPHVPDARVIGQAHLLPELRKGRGGHPLVADRVAVVIHVIVHAPAAAPRLELPGHFRRGQAAHEAVIVLAEHADGVPQAVPVLEARHAFIAVEEGLNLLVQRQQPGLIL